MEKIPAFYFDKKKLDLLAKEHKVEFANAKPFSHIVIDNFLDKDILDLLIKEFPNNSNPAWIEWGPGQTTSTSKKHRRKRGLSDENQFAPFTRHFMGQIISQTFIDFLSKLTDIKDIVVDPSFNSCGLHSTGRGGKLMIHADDNRHPIKKGDF